MSLVRRIWAIQGPSSVTVVRWPLSVKSSRIGAGATVAGRRIASQLPPRPAAMMSAAAMRHAGRERLRSGTTRAPSAAVRARCIDHAASAFHDGSPAEL